MYIGNTFHLSEKYLINDALTLANYIQHVILFSANVYITSYLLLYVD